MDGCDTGQYAKGYCNKHYVRMRTNGTTDSVRQPGHRRDREIPLSMSEADIAWLAGLLEGEGSFFMSRCPNKGVMYSYPCIVVDMTDRDVIDRVAGFFGTKVYPYKNLKRPEHKEIYKSMISGSRAVEFMQMLLPWMGVRRSAKIKELLETPSGRKEVQP